MSEHGRAELITKPRIALIFHYRHGTLGLKVEIKTGSSLESVENGQGRNYRPCRPCHAGGPTDPVGPSRLPENIFFTVRPCSISGVYGFALSDEFVGTDPLDRACFARNVFLISWLAGI